MNELTNGDFNNGTMIRVSEDGKLYTNYTFKQYNKEKRIVESVKTDELVKSFIGDKTTGERGVGISKYLQNLVIDANMLENLKDINDITYGQAFEKGFELFEDVDNFRKTIKTLEVVRYSAYKYKLNEEFKKIAIQKGISKSDLDKGYVQLKLTEFDIRSAKSSLNKQGFVHNVKDSNNANQSLSATEKSLIGQTVRVSFGSKKLNTLTSTPVNQQETENTGASGVVTIHQLDGRKIGLSLEGTGMLNIYDAFYSSLGSMTQISNNMNQEFVNVTTSYHVLDTHLEQIENMLLTLGKDGIQEMIEGIYNSPAEKEIIKSGMKKIDTDWFKGKESEADKIVSMINKTIDIKESLSSNETDIDVMHNYLTDRTEFGKGKAFGYKNKNVDIPNIYYILGRIITSAITPEDIGDGESHFDKYQSRYDENYSFYKHTNTEMQMKDVIDKEILDKEVGAIDNIINGIFGVTNDKTNSKEVPNEIKDIMNEIKKCIK